MKSYNTARSSYHTGDNAFSTVSDVALCFDCRLDCPLYIDCTVYTDGPVFTG